jgi:sigma-B regulation protein RsbU (phosphoserine phosphatase)
LDNSFIWRADLFKLPEFIVPEMILNHTNDGIYVTDPDCRILYWNQACERITGWRAEEVLGKLCSEGILMHVDRQGNRLCQPGLCPLHRCMASNTLSSEPVMVYANHKEGHRVPVAVSVAPMHDPGGRVIAGVEVFRDISARMRDLERARLVQGHFMHPKLPQGRVTFQAQYLPHDLVGGDYYQVRTLDDGRQAFLLADVMGHGVSAALYTMILHTYWHENAQLLDRPAAFLSHINRELYEQTLSDSFITCFMGLVDPESGRLEYASAGHPPPLLLGPEGGVTDLESLDLPLAMLPEHDFSQTSLNMPEDSHLLLYSDGALEATSPDGVQFGHERLRNLLAHTQGQESAQALETIQRNLLEFAESVSLEDDLALLLVSRHA